MLARDRIVAGLAAVAAGAIAACHVQVQSELTRPIASERISHPDGAIARRPALVWTDAGQLRFVEPLECASEELVRQHTTIEIATRPNLATFIVGLLAATLGGVIATTGLFSTEPGTSPYTYAGLAGTGIGLPLAIGPWIGNHTESRELSDRDAGLVRRPGPRQPCGARALAARSATLEVSGLQIHGAIDRDGRFSISPYQWIDAYNAAAAPAQDITAIVDEGGARTTGAAESRGVGTPTARPTGRGASPVGSTGEAESRGVGTPTARPAGRGASPVGSTGEAESREVEHPTARPAGRAASPVGSAGEAESREVGPATARPAERGASPVGSTGEAEPRGVGPATESIATVLDAGAIGAHARAYLAHADFDAAVEPLRLVPGIAAAALDARLVTADGNAAVRVVLALRNDGPGDAWGLRGQITAPATPAIDGRMIYIGKLARGAAVSRQLVIPVTARAASALRGATLELSVELRDAHGTAPTTPVKFRGALPADATQ